MAKSMEEIAQLLNNTKFKRSIIGGINEADLWKKLERLQAEYSEVVAVEQAKTKELLSEKEETIKELQKQIQELSNEIKV